MSPRSATHRRDFAHAKRNEQSSQNNAHIPAWGQAYLNHHKAFRCWKFQVTEFRVASEL